MRAGFPGELASTMSVIPTPPRTGTDSSRSVRGTKSLCSRTRPESPRRPQSRTCCGRPLIGSGRRASGSSATSPIGSRSGAIHRGHGFRSRSGTSSSPMDGARTTSRTSRMSLVQRPPRTRSPARWNCSVLDPTWMLGGHPHLLPHDRRVEPLHLPPESRGFRNRTVRGEVHADRGSRRAGDSTIPDVHIRALARVRSVLDDRGGEQQPCGIEDWELHQAPP